MGGDAVGEVVKSLTTHVFYVLDNGCADSIITAWENALSFAFGTDLIETVDKDYDDVSLTKDQIDTSAENAKKLVAAETDAHATNLVDTTKNFTPKGIKEGDRQPATAATPNP
jgi:hypothetical protein